MFIVRNIRLFWRCKGLLENELRCFSSGLLGQTQGEFSDLIDEMVSTRSERETNFAKLFKTSKFVQLGDFEGRLVVGKIIHRIGTDLYIDFGSKFNAVCKSPDDKEGYLVGASVLLRLHDPELSERFLGSRYDLTLLEADATLLGLYGKRSSNKVVSDE